VLFFTNEWYTEMGCLADWSGDEYWEAERTLPQDEPIRFRLADERVTHWAKLTAPPKADSSLTK
jgi:hypothetical protein